MSYTLVVEPSAARDIADSYAFFAEQGRGDAFMVEVDHVFAQISERALSTPSYMQRFTAPCSAGLRTRSSSSSKRIKQSFLPCITNAAIRP